MSQRVAETTTDSPSGNWSPAADIDWSRRSSAEADLNVSWAPTEKAALTKPTKTKHNGRFRITSFLQLESRTCLSSAAAKSASPSSHSSFCEEVFSRSEPDWHLPEVRFCSADANSDFFSWVQRHAGE